MKTLMRCTLAATLLLTTSLSWSSSQQSLAFEQRWAQIQNEEDMSKRVEPFKQLLTDINDRPDTNPDDIGVLIVRGNTNLELANALHNLSSLKYLKRGVKDLRKAIKSEPLAMGGMAEASLAAALYWAPSMLGDKEESQDLFETALQQMPESFELHAQYAYTLKADEKPEKAEQHSKKALAILRSIEQPERRVLLQSRIKELEVFLASLQEGDTGERFWDRKEQGE